MTQIKASYGAAVLFLSRPAQLHSNIFQKEEGPCSLEMCKLISNWHQSEFWSPGFWVTRSSRKKKKKRRSRVVHPLQKAWNWLGVSGGSLTGVWCTNLTHLKQKNPTILSDEAWVHWKHVLPPENRPALAILHAESVTNTNSFHKKEQTVWISTNRSKTPEHVQHVWLLIWPSRERERIERVGGGGG